MSFLNTLRAKPWLSALRQEFVEWGKTEGMGWIFVFKTTFAALLAMGISLRLDLGQPVTAMVTVYVIMQPQTGMVLTKNLYRICGTLAGTIASLALLGLFSQERILFLLGLSAWIGLCTTGAALYRNFKSYGFTLAGYTAAMISLPLVMQPTGFFDYAVNRASEVLVGILCAGIVSDIVFPQSLGDTIERTIQARYTDFIRYVQAMLSGNIEPQEIDRVHLRFTVNVMNLESLRSSVMLEASKIRTHNLRLRRLNQDFMAAATTLHSLYQLLNRLKKADTPATQTLTTLSKSLSGVLVTENEPARTSKEAQQTARRLAAFRAAFPKHIENMRYRYLPISDNQENLDCETAVELLNRFIRELHDYTRTYAFLETDRHNSSQPENILFASRTDPTVALLAGMRAFVVVLLVAAFWIASAWPNGASAVMMAAIGSSLFAPAPDPARAVKMGVLGTMAGFIAAILCKFCILTSLDGFGLLCVGMIPFMLAGPYLTLSPKLAGVGLGYSTMFCFMISPTNWMQYDPMGFINFGISLMLGLTSAAIIFATLMPVTGSWLKRRTSRLLCRQAEMACFGALPSLTSRFESSTRDILRRLATKQVVQDSHDRDILDWVFIVLEIGRSIIHLRQDAESIPLSQSLIESVKNTIQSTAYLFKRPNGQHHGTALEYAENSIKTILVELDREGLCGHSREVLRRMLTSLHLIRTSLLDDETILAFTLAELQTNLRGETHYAT